MAEQQTAKILPEEESTIRAIFNTMAAEESNMRDGCLASARLFDLSCVLNEPLSSVDLDRATKQLGPRVALNDFLDFWINDDYEDLRAGN